MDKKIIVAGAGHGGIAVAAQLAKAGFDVTVYDRGQKGEQGYDWEDAVDPKAFEKADIPFPPEDMWGWRANITFFGPSSKEKSKVRQTIKPGWEDQEIRIERKVLYKHIIGYAESCGVKFVYGETVKGPIMKGNRVVGIKTDKGEHKGDLIIDACGLESELRANLPDSLGIQKHPSFGEKFYIYRAYYDMPIDAKTVEDEYAIALLPRGELGIDWVETEPTYSDVLIGRFNPLTQEDIDRNLEINQKMYPQLGKKFLRGGGYTELPVRQPLSIMVADGYAAIGDSAFMTIPVIGSGIGLCFKSSKFLSETIINDKTGKYTAKTLWPYQVKYYKNYGAGLAPLAAFKRLLTAVDGDELDYAFDKGIITKHELNITSNHTSLWKFLEFDPKLPLRAIALVKNPPLLKKGAIVVGQLVEVVLVCTLMPKKYNKLLVRKWAKAYDKIFVKPIVK